MTKKEKYCRCGRKILFYSHHMGRWKVDKTHQLCSKCFRSMMQSMCGKGGVTWTN